jgi:hypothetical protein
VQSPPQQGFIVTVVQTPTKQTTLQDVVLGSLGITGVLLLLALVLGALMAGLLYVWHRRHPPEDNRLPPVSPLVSGGPTTPPVQ